MTHSVFYLKFFLAILKQLIFSIKIFKSLCYAQFLYSDNNLKVNKVFTVILISNQVLHIGWFLAKCNYHRRRAIEDGVGQPVVLSQPGQDKELTKNKIWESYRARPHSINKNAREKSYIEIREATNASVQLTVLNSKRVSLQKKGNWILHRWKATNAEISSA